MYRRLLLPLIVGPLLLQLGCSGEGDPTFPGGDPATLSITNESLTDGALTIAYPGRLFATGGDGTWTWEITDGTLPAGLTLGLDLGGGAPITGVPTALGISDLTFEVTSGDGQTASKALSITVVTATLSVTTSSALDEVSMVDPVTDAVEDSVYSFSLKASGGDGVYTWALPVGSSLPAGLTLAADGKITGTPTAAGIEYFTVKVVSGDAQAAFQALSLTVNTPLTIVTISLPDAVGGAEYAVLLEAAGGDGANEWWVSQDTIVDLDDDTTYVTDLPTGLTISENGLIAGTPTGFGDSDFTVFVKDGNKQTASRMLSIDVTLSVVTSSLSDAAQNVKYEETLVAMGGDGSAYTWSVAAGDTLPAGLTLVDSTGVISGTPTAAGRVVFTVEVEDGDAETTTRVLSITVQLGTLTITTSSLPDGEENVAYADSVVVIGGDGAYTWSVAGGGLPTGLSLGTADGKITGTPTVPGTVFFTVQVLDATGAAAIRGFSITVTRTLAVTTISLPVGVTLAAYGEIQLEAIGGDGDYEWSITVGELPAGMTLDEDDDGVSLGVISGTPTAIAVGTSFTVEVEDGDGRTATRELSITVTKP